MVSACETVLCPFKDVCYRNEIETDIGYTYLIDHYVFEDNTYKCESFWGNDNEYNKLRKQIKRSNTIKSVIDQKD